MSDKWVDAWQWLAIAMVSNNRAVVHIARKEQTMSRWIDADDALELLNLMYDNQEDKDDPYNVGVMGAINYIKHKAPSIDIVRCQDCKHWVYNFNGCARNPCTEPWYATDFCNYGEREGE